MSVFGGVDGCGCGGSVSIVVVVICPLPLGRYTAVVCSGTEAMSETIMQWESTTRACSVYETGRER